MKFLILISILYNNEYWVLWLHRKVEYSDKINSFWLQWLFDYNDYYWLYGYINNNWLFNNIDLIDYEDVYDYIDY